MQTRKIQRKTISLPGRYFTGCGEPVDVTLRDLSVGGCRFVASGPGLTPGTRLQMFIANSGPYRALVKWAENGEIGVTFSAPLPEAEFEKFKNSHVPEVADYAPTAASTSGNAAFEDMPEARPNRFC